jgi:hypothetical protein
MIRLPSRRRTLDLVVSGGPLIGYRRLSLPLPKRDVNQLASPADRHRLCQVS